MACNFFNAVRCIDGYQSVGDDKKSTSRRVRIGNVFVSHSHTTNVFQPSSRRAAIFR